MTGFIKKLFVKKCSLDKAYAWLKKHQFDRLEVHEAVYALSKEELEAFLSEKFYGDIKAAIDLLNEDEVKDLMKEGETIEEFRKRLKETIQKPRYILADKEMRDCMEERYRQIYGEDYYSNNEENDYNDDDDKDDSKEETDKN